MLESIVSLDKEYVAGTYGRFPVELIKGQGSILTDINGKEYIDMGSGIGVAAFGHNDPQWNAAVTAQLSALAHVSNLYYTQPCAKLAALMCQKTGMKKVFFGNSGAEANECAIKVARKYSAEKKGPQYHNIITLKNSFHGRTLTTLSATGQEHYHELFQPLTPGFIHTDAGDVAQLEEILKNHPAAGIMLEIVQGEGGVIPLTKDYVAAVAKIAKDQDIPLIIDEVQTGNGRTGALYAYMHYGIEPDIVSTAKGLGGGLPIGACMLGQKVQDVLKPGDHGSTYGGNPVCSAGALSVMERLTPEFIEQVQKTSRYIFDQLKDAPGIEEITGLGLMIGIKTTKPAKDVVVACMEQGVLCLTAKDKVRLLPPLNTPMPCIEKAVEVIKTCCQ